MSVNYFIVCDDHKERVEAAQRIERDCHFLRDAAHLLPAFIIAHRKCQVRILSEFDPDATSGAYRDWAYGFTRFGAGHKSEVWRAIEDGRWADTGEVRLILVNTCSNCAHHGGRIAHPFCNKHDLEEVTPSTICDDYSPELTAEIRGGDRLSI